MGRTISTPAASNAVSSIQQVSATITNSGGSSNQSISAVDTAKTVLVEAGQKLGFASGADASVRARTCATALGIRAYLSSTTNVALVASARPNSFNTFSSGGTTARVTVVEYN